jgi:homoserine kinase
MPSPLTQVRVPASTSNLGSGFDCLGLALDLWLQARLVEGTGDPIYSGTLSGIKQDDDFLFLTLGGSLQPGLRLEVESDIPVSRGLGSSAAARVAGLVLSRLVAGAAPERDSIFDSTEKLEGHPDNAGPAVYGGLVLSARRPKVLELHSSLGIALAIPEQPVSTQAARAILPKQVVREDAISQASRSAALLLGLTLGDADLIGYGMEDLIAVPHRRQLIPGFLAAAKTGVEAGAYGVTISGAGSGIVGVAAKEAADDVAQAMATELTQRGNTAAALWPAVVTGGYKVGGDRS